jgi:hypothetical protein
MNLEDVKEKKIPNLQSVLNDMPMLISKCVSLMDTVEEKIMGLYASIAILGSLLPKVWFNYDSKKNYLQIMVLIVFPPASGKGKVNMFFRLVYRINQEQISHNNDLMKRYNISLEKVKRAKKSEEIIIPEKPNLPLLTVPGNTTSSKLIEQLAENNGEMAALILESEIDGLTNIMSNQHGKDNSMILRKAFHNETISHMRKNNAEHLVVHNPKLAIVITGTPSQIKSLFQSNQDGSLSRFTSYEGYAKVEWKDVKPCEECHPLDEKFDLIAESYYAFYHHYKNKEVEIKFTDEQWESNNEFGDKLLQVSMAEGGEFATSIAKRHINMLSRIAATLTIVRCFENHIEDSVVFCTDEDYLSAFWLTEKSFQSSLSIFQSLPGEKEDTDHSIDEFFDNLPDEFMKKEIAPLQALLNISERTISRNLSVLVKKGKLHSVKRGSYKKC